MTDHRPDSNSGAARTAAPLHPLSRRILHWVNALAIILMVGSGWRIYDEHPELPLDCGLILRRSD